MSLQRIRKNSKRAFDKQSLKDLYHTQHNVFESETVLRNKFISEVYALFVASLVISAVGAGVGVAIGLDYTYFWPFFMFELLLLIFAMQVRRMPGLNLVVLFSFTGFSGFTISPFLNVVIAMGQADLIYLAFALSLGIFIILSAYVHLTKQDFSWMGGLLFTSLIILIAAGLAGMMFPGMLDMVLYCSVSLFIFCGFVLYDTSRIIIKYDTDEYVAATLDLYLDFINIFLDILRILIQKPMEGLSDMGIGDGSDVDLDFDIDI